MNPQQQNMYMQSFPPITPVAYPNNFSPMMQNTQQTIQPQQMSYNGMIVPQQSAYEVVPQVPLQQIQFQSLPSTSSNPPHLGYHPQQIVRMTSTSEEEIDETQGTNNIPWQQVKSTKRKKITRIANNNGTKKITTNNKFSALTVEGNNQQDTDSTVKTSNPPPIYIYGVTDYRKMVIQIRNCLEDEQYTTKSLANNTIRINCNIAESYRKLIRYFKEENIIHHSYQLKEDRAYRVVIKHLHNSIPTADIADELTKLGHKVRNIINGRHRTTKEPLNLFFVDLEPANNNKEIYNIEKLQNTNVKIEPPHKTKNDIVQCIRCQLYGHSKTYCNRPYVCVKCGGSHSTESCKKSKETPATCALCGGDHPANYKGCEYYHKLIQGNHTKKVSATKQTNYNNVNPSPNNYLGSHQNQNRTYSDVVNNYPNNASTTDTSNNILSQFLNEFKAMFNQLIQQNSMVLNMLTTLISKLVH